MSDSNTIKLATSEHYPLPKNAQANWLTTNYGNLRYLITKPNGKKVNGTIVLIHGYSECIEKYYHVIEAFLERNYAVAMLDWRGHGLSETFIDKEADYFRQMDFDFDKFMHEIVQDTLPKPYIAVAHSMGGCLTMSAIHRHPDLFDAIILSSPMLGIKQLSKLPLLKYVAKLINFTNDKFNYNFNISENHIAYTSDQQRFYRFRSLQHENPELLKNFNQYKWFESAATRLAIMQSKNWYQRIATPCLFLIAGIETLVAPEESRKAAEMMPNAKFEIIANALHEVLMEKKEIQDKVWQLIDNFLIKNINEKKVN